MMEHNLEQANHNISTPKISVIVPVYNTAKYLKRCVESLIDQTLRDIEIILIDDGSKDQSPDICDEYARNDSRVYVIHKQNQGQGLARNDGIKAANGEYICFLDSDDYYEPKTCEILVDTMESTAADICSYGYQMDDSEGNLVKRPAIKDKEYIGKEGIRQFILHYFGDAMDDDELRGVSSCMSVFKRSIIREYNIDFPSERVVSSEDTAFCLEFCKYVSKAVTISDSLYHYCQNEGSFSQGYKPDRLRLMKAHIALLNDYAKQYDNYDQVKDRIAMTAWINLLAHYKQIYRNQPKPKALIAMKETAEDPDVKGAMVHLLVKQLPLKQQVLHAFIRNKLYRLAYRIVGIRAKSRL